VRGNLTLGACAGGRLGVESGHPGGAQFLTFARVAKSCGAAKMILAVTGPAIAIPGCTYR
jgi:hypothetical protein